MELSTLLSLNLFLKVSIPIELSYIVPLMKDAETMAGIIFKEEERVTLRKALDQARESLMVIIKTLENKGRTLDVAISNVAPTEEVT